MATWQEIRNYINSNYKVDEDDGNVISLTFGSPDGRSQMILVSYYDLKDPLIVFKSPIAAVSEVSAGQLLDLTSKDFWGVSSTGDYYVVNHVQFAATVDSPEIDLALAYVAGAADGFEEALGLGDRF